MDDVLTVITGIGAGKNLGGGAAPLEHDALTTGYLLPSAEDSPITSAYNVFVQGYNAYEAYQQTFGRSYTRTVTKQRKRRRGANGSFLHPLQRDHTWPWKYSNRRGL